MFQLSRSENTRVCLLIRTMEEAAQLQTTRLRFSICRVKPLDLISETFPSVFTETESGILGPNVIVS